MLDIKFIRENKGVVKEGVSNKGEDPSKVDDVLVFDEKRRHVLQQAEQLKARKNTVSSEVAKKKCKGEDASAVVE